MPAAGVGSRMGADKPKQYLPLLGKTILEHTLERLLTLPQLHGVVVVLSPNDTIGRALGVLSHEKVSIVSGGRERCDSVINGLASLRDNVADSDWVLVHDAARPCVARSDILKLLTQLSEHPVGGILATPVSDTIKRVSSGTVTTTVDRSVLWQAQTPQMFRYGLLLSALQQAFADGAVITDEASALEHAGFTPAVVEGRRDNIKVTRPEDLPVAELILKSNQAGQ